MTPSEMVTLTRYVRGACPQQKIDEFTPDIWHDLIGDLDLADCRAAVATITGSRSPFVAPAEIRAEVQRIRSERIARSVIPAPAPELTDDPRAYQRALRAGIAKAAEGRAPLISDQPRPLALDEPAAGLRAIEGPQRLGAAMAQLRRKLGPARARSAALASPQEIARRKAAESRAERERAEGSEAS